jgi:hypothetical protein
MVWAPARSDTSPEHRDFFGGRNATKMGSTKVNKMLVLRRKIKDDLLAWPTNQDGGFFYHQFIDG